MPQLTPLPRAPRPADGHRSLSAPECRSWLASHREGRLGYRSGSGDRAVPVSYALAGEEVVFRVAEYNQLLQYAVGADVTLAVEGRTDEDLTETVTVSGTAQAESDSSALALVALPES